MDIQKRTMPGPPDLEEMVRLFAYVSSAVIDSAPIEQRFGSICSCIATAFNADACVVRHIQDKKLHLLAVSGVPAHLLPPYFPTDQGIAARLMETRSGLIVADVPSDPITADLHAKSPAGHFKFRQYAGAPMLMENATIGIVAIYRLKSDPPFSPEELRYLEIVANQLAVALHTSRLYAQQVENGDVLQKEIRQRKRTEKKLQTQLARAENLASSNEQLVRQLEEALAQLSASYQASLEGWCAALDMRDEGTMGHTQRVTELAVQLAERVGYPIEHMDNFRRGALLHDIGKMGIPDAILLKDGKLSEDEWDIMKKHPRVANEFLLKTVFLTEAAEIPLCHHERWDGTGYPCGLKGEAIPLSARIFAVVDVWDALNSDRPYRSAWPRQDAIKYINNCRGTHFDPNVVDSFLELISADNSQ